MSQNLVDLNIDPAALPAIDQALNTLETHLAGLMALTPEQRRSLAKMGDKSEAFCRQALHIVQQNPGVVARNFDIDGYTRDLQNLDLLQPWLQRIARLYQRMSDTETALGSDLMAGALEAYAFLKVAGKGQGLDEARRTLSARFNRKRAAEPAADGAPAA